MRPPKHDAAGGPSLVDELVTYRSCIKNLVFKDLKLKYRDSFLGFLWSLLNPLMMLAIYTLAFKHIFRVKLDNYPFFLLVGLMPWHFFAGSVSASTQSIIGNASLLRKVYFPREILPIATVLFTFAQFLLALAVVLPASIFIFGMSVKWPALLFLPLLLMHVVFTIGIGFALSAMTTFFRDVAHFTEMALMMLIWVTPIMYSAEMAPPGLQAFFAVSPLAAFAISYQDVLYRGIVPPSSVLLVAAAWTIVALVGGLTIFRWNSPAFAEAV
jgi:homopolymeric O-antigen transport system permease protein